MLIVLEHHREEEYEARNSLTCKWEPTDRHMLNVKNWTRWVHSHTWDHTNSTYLCILYPDWGENVILRARSSGYRTFRLSCGGNVFPKEIVFPLWHCWRCAICNPKSEKFALQRGEIGTAIGWVWRPQSQKWSREESEADPSTQGPQILNDIQPNTHWRLHFKPDVTLRAAWTVLHPAPHHVALQVGYAVWGHVGRTGTASEQQRTELDTTVPSISVAETSVWTTEMLTATQG